MTGDQLRHMRENRQETREQFAEFLGDCSASTVNKWERDINPVPGWVEEKLMRNVRIEFSIPHLHELLDLAREEKISFDQLLSEGAQLVIEKRRSKSSAPSTVTTGAKSQTAKPATSAGTITPLPPQHFLAADDLASADSEQQLPTKKVSYGSGRKKKGA